jgi:hypothetical protein
MSTGKNWIGAKIIGRIMALEEIGPGESAEFNS